MEDKNEGTDIRKTFFYDSKEDRDIHEWIESLPPRSHSDFIRKAIREYISIEKRNQNVGNNDELREKVEKLEEELTLLKNYVMRDDRSGQTEQSEPEIEEGKGKKYVDASHILENLGK